MMGISGYSGIEYGGYSNVSVGMYGSAGMSGTQGADRTGRIGLDENQDTGVRSSRECQTCKNRKYVDGSNEADVSFKTPGHIAPENSASMVMAHEQMHVSNARQEGGKENASLVSASVRLKMAVCPECGRSYVEGGVTNTTIKYTESNPYERNRKLLEGSFLKGQYIDAYAG